jgi:RHS repeat-associated protein
MDEPLVLDLANGSRYFYHQNAQSSTFALTNATGTVVEGYQYDAYGQQTVLEADFVTPIGPTSTVGNPYMFTGQRLDPETGLFYYKHRYYSTNLGRFISRDPMEYADGTNLYEYAASNPLTYADPSGLEDTLLTLKDIATLRDESQKVVDKIREKNKDDDRLLFLDTQQCILDELAKGACCTGSKQATDWLVRVLRVFQGSLNNALAGRIAPPNPEGKPPTREYIQGMIDFYAGKVGGNWWKTGIEAKFPQMDKLTGGLRPTPSEARAIAMFMAHINFDLQYAIALEGVGTDADWKCIGDVVSKCARKVNGRLPALLEAMGRIMYPGIDPIVWRDAIRKGVIEDWYEKLAGVKNPQGNQPYVGLRPGMEKAAQTQLKKANE